MYAVGYIVLALRSSVCPFACSFVRTCTSFSQVPEIYDKDLVKVSQVVYIIVATKIRKHSFPWRIGIYIITSDLETKLYDTFKKLYSVILTYADILTNHLLVSIHIWTIGTIRSWLALDGFRHLD